MSSRRSATVEHGGKLEGDTLAQFIFSNDWDHKDTKRFFSSPAYLEQHLAIFKSSFVTDCVKRGIRNTALGSYILIPAHIEKCLHNNSDLDEEKNESFATDMSQLADNQGDYGEHSLPFLPHTSEQTSGMVGWQRERILPHKPDSQNNGSQAQHSASQNERNLSHNSKNLFHNANFQPKILIDRLNSVDVDQLQRSCVAEHKSNSRSYKLERDSNDSPGQRQSSPSCKHLKSYSKSNQESSEYDGEIDHVHIDEMPQVTGVMSTLYSYHMQT